MLHNGQRTTSVGCSSPLLTASTLPKNVLAEIDVIVPIYADKYSGSIVQLTGGSSLVRHLHINIAATQFVKHLSEACPLGFDALC